MEARIAMLGSHYRVSSVSFQLSEFACRQKLINVTELWRPSDALEQPDKLLESVTSPSVTSNHSSGD